MLIRELDMLLWMHSVSMKSRIQFKSGFTSVMDSNIEGCVRKPRESWELHLRRGHPQIGTKSCMDLDSDLTNKILSLSWAGGHLGQLSAKHLRTSNIRCRACASHTLQEENARDMQAGLCGKGPAAREIKVQISEESKSDAPRKYLSHRHVKDIVWACVEQPLWSTTVTGKNSHMDSSLPRAANEHSTYGGKRKTDVPDTLKELLRRCRCKALTNGNQFVLVHNDRLDGKKAGLGCRIGDDSYSAEAAQLAERYTEVRARLLFELDAALLKGGLHLLLTRVLV
nr:hypothetical protein CFP56_07603 [Quercus suber]